MPFLPHPLRSPKTLVSRPVLAVVAVLVVLAAACSSPPTPQPITADDAINALTESGQSEDIAECIVGLLSSRITPRDLVVGTELSASDELLVEEATTNCEVAAGLLAEEGPPPEDLAFDLTPQIYGDDPVLDQLWDACAEGVGQACDNLWAEAPIGSTYERFGVTCGERFEILNCADEMDSPGDDEDDSGSSNTPR